MNARARWVLNSLLVLLFSVSVAPAQQNASGPGAHAFAQAELDQMLAPIALYPDPLLSQILMASTYPREVIEAARWSRDNPDLNGDRAVRAVERIDWDASVKSLVAFPQILDRMDDKVNWTEELGNAFLGQQAQVMDTVQYLRRQAYSTGNLASTDQLRVDFQDSNFTINFANPEIVYLPYYNPAVVYGTWWWPAYQPVYWAPWPGYYARPGYARGFAWGPAIPVSRGFFFGAPDWHRHNVNIINVNNYYYRPVYVNRQTEITHNVNVVHGEPHAWQHDGAHRRDVPYRDASWRQPVARADALPEARHESRERDAPAIHGRGVADNVTAVAAQPETRSVVSQPHTAAAAERMPRGAPSRGAVQREQDSRGFEGRGEFAHRPEARIDSGNRPSDRGNHPQIAGRMGAPPPVVEHAPAATAALPVASPPAARSMPVPTQVQVAGRHPNVEQRANVATAAPAPDGAGRRADARPAGGREHAGHAAAAPADNTVAAAATSGNTSAPQAAGNARGNGGNSRRLQ